MVQRTATVGLLAVFLTTLLCAIVCPEGAAHAANHVCDMPDHSCCPAPQQNGELRVSQCLDTHFVSGAKSDDFRPEITAIVEYAAHAERSNLSAAETWKAPGSSLGPPIDILTLQHLLRI